MTIEYCGSQKFANLLKFHLRVAFFAPHNSRTFNRVGFLRCVFSTCAKQPTRWVTNPSVQPNASVRDDPSFPTPVKLHGRISSFRRKLERSIERLRQMTNDEAEAARKKELVSRLAQGRAEAKAAKNAAVEV